MGLFGLTISERYGGLGESLLTYALVVEQLARGWMSVSGIINTHFIVAYLIAQHGTEEQKRLLPKMASGEIRGAFSMSEPECGSDVAAIKTRARAADREFVLDGQKTWLTNGARAGVVATLVKDELDGGSAYKNMTTFLIEKQPGFGQTRPGLTIPGQIDKMGYKGAETTEMVLDGVRLPAGAILGGPAGRGRGFYQMMDGIEVGRVNVAARACGMSIRAFELAVAYAQQRRTFGKPIAGHQAIAFQGVRNRAADAGGPVPAHRRGHLRDPEDHHQPRPPARVRRRPVTSSVALKRLECRHQPSADPSVSWRANMPSPDSCAPPRRAAISSSASCSPASHCRVKHHA